MNETSSTSEPSRSQRFRRWFSQTFYWWLLLIPAIHLGLISYLSQQKIGIFHNEVDPKVLFEQIHPAILVVFTLLSLQGWRLTRRYAFGWMTIFGCVLFCREMHFYGSGPILVGGLLLWQDEENYLCLNWGQRRPDEIGFEGCIDNADLVFGRGKLPGDSIRLRLERNGDQVRALCSADGETWHTAGQTEFPVADSIQAGLFAIGNIDRAVYPGAFPDGTAIRFRDLLLLHP